MPCPCGDPDCSGPLDHMKTAAIIREHGWQTVAVGGGQGRPTMVYTIGLTGLGHPEFVAFGLPAKAAHVFFGELVARLDGGTVRHGAVIDDLAHGGFRTAFVSLPSDVACRDHLIQARGYYGRDVEVLQMVWPDRSGAFPWEPGFDPSLTWMQDQVTRLSDPTVRAAFEVPDAAPVPAA